MQISRVVIRNFRSFEELDVPISQNTTCVIGENNSGKTNFLHAIRLCVDSNLSSTYRSLLGNDIHSTVDISHPNQVLVGLEIVDFAGKINEEALVGAWQCEPGKARVFYRFRPKLSIREDLAADEIAPGDLTIEDYHWEICGGGDPARDLTAISWDEDLGTSIRFSDLQSFLVVFLPALRDVESDLRQFRSSPLARLIRAMDIDIAEQEDLVEKLRVANEEIAEAPSIKKIAESIDESFKKVAGPAFSMDVDLGVAEPSFQTIVRTLRVLLSNVALDDFDPSSNGLGLNNILYVSILIEYFQKRIEQQKSAGQILLIEEPEAHLHPQLQLTLFNALRDLPFQSILTTHSTHITAHADLESYVVLTQRGVPAVSASVPAEDESISNQEVSDLERYLDATKSNLLYAKKVMLVEGPAELFLIPPIVKEVMDIDLDREGISVVPIYGVHFDVYAKLFGEAALPKKCAIITDGDLKPSDANPEVEGEDELPPPPNFAPLENDFVKVFACATTFERAITLSSTLNMFAMAAEEIGAPRIAQRLRAGIEALKDPTLNGEDRKAILTPLRAAVLNTSIRFGKARFAQIAARHVEHAGGIPKYLRESIEWLLEP
ncbi:MAG: ATP-dependent endonuclease [Desulfuromonadales bacterium]|nr:ATP-dependent endonuclease [Desulfuromonadales bacterium]